MLKSLSLTWLALNGTINVWHITLLCLLQGVVNTFEIPTRQAFLPETVSKENLGNALALYSSLVSVPLPQNMALTVKERALRTFTLHDPVDYKLRDIGNWLLNHELPTIAQYS